MNSIANKIKLNNNLWFTVLGNKLVFGNSDLGGELHYTFSFGNRSGIFDLHMTNARGDHFTILEMPHQDIFSILPSLLDKIKYSVLDLSEFDPNENLSKDSVVYRIEQFSDITGELGVLTKKDKVIIDKNSQEFKYFVDKLLKRQSIKVVEVTYLETEVQFFGLVRSKNESFFLIKNPFLGNQLFRINNIDLDLDSVILKILGRDQYDRILKRINEGFLYLRT